jgi:L-threonylcarbamoyladenylate synthase
LVPIVSSVTLFWLPVLGISLKKGRQVVATAADGAAHPAPGMHERHYAPKTPLVMIKAGEPQPAGRVAWVPCIGAPSDYAAQLYATLRALDDQGFDAIAVERPPDSPEWAAVLDRLRRAAT